MADIDPINAANALTSIIAAIGGFPSASTSAPPGDSTTVTSDTASMSSPTDTAGDQFVFPGAQQYGVNSPFGGSRGHPGIDLAFPDHTPVLAAMSGTIIAAVDSNDPGTYNVVRIQHPNGVVTEYGHLSGVNVHVGDTVKAGQQIGISGGAAGERGTYNSTGPHLHFQVDVNGQPVDPAPFLAGAHAIVGTTGGTVTTTTTSSTPEQKLGYAAQSIATAMTSGEGLPQPRGDLESKTTTTSTLTPGSAGSTLSGATSGADNDPAAVDAFLAATRQHESGGNYQIYNQSGQSDASGAYQFLSSTWKAMGGSTATAAQASPAEQDAIARKMAMQLFDKYHSWRLVAIAWYGGPGVADIAASGRDPGAPSGQGSYLAYGDTIARMMSGGA